MAAGGEQEHNEVLVDRAEGSRNLGGGVHGGGAHGGGAHGDEAHDGGAQDVGQQGREAHGNVAHAGAVDVGGGVHGARALDVGAQGVGPQDRGAHGNVAQAGAEDVGGRVHGVRAHDGGAQGVGEQDRGAQAGAALVRVERDVAQGRWTQEDGAQGDGAQGDWAQGDWTPGGGAQGWGEVQVQETQVGRHQSVTKYGPVSRLVEGVPQTGVSQEVFGSRVAREKAKVENIVKQLTQNSSTKIDHKKSILETATVLNNLKCHDSSEYGEDTYETIRLAVEDSNTTEDVLQQLWNCPAVRNYFSTRENSSNLEDLLALSSSSTPLNRFPPDINSNIYSDIIAYGLQHSRGMIVLLLNLLVKNDHPVQEKDVIRIGYLFSLLAHAVSRKNNSLAKTKSLLLQAQGITVEGLDALSFLGICEAGCATRTTTDLLAEVTDSLLKMNCKTRPTQVIVDNLDFLQEHMTIDYKEVEAISTSHLSDAGMNSSEIPYLFDEREIMIEDEKHKEELKHVKTVVANTVGRLLGDKVKKVRMMCILATLKCPTKSFT